MTFRPIQALSLGGVCQVAYQIERRFGFRVASPFDWLVTPLASIEKVFSDDGAMFGLDVEIIGETAICRHYGVGYHHEFPRDEGRRPIVTPDALASCRLKLRHKYAQFVDRLNSGTPTLLIRMTGHARHGAPYPYVHDLDAVTAADLHRLACLIADKFPQADFRVAFVFQSKFTMLAIAHPLDARVVPIALPFTTMDWFGDDAAWDAVFAQCTLSPQRPAIVAGAEHLHP